MENKLTFHIEEDWTQYHSYDEIVTGILELNGSNIAEAVDIGESVEGRTIWAIKISDDPRTYNNNGANNTRTIALRTNSDSCTTCSSSIDSAHQKKTNQPLMQIKDLIS
jgi:hypothetical protein